MIFRLKYKLAVNSILKYNFIINYEYIHIVLHKYLIVSLMDLDANDQKRRKCLFFF